MQQFHPLPLVALAALAACAESRAPQAPGAPAEFAGSAACADCHAPQFAAWTNSHHDLAMQVADTSTVLGDFEQASYDYFGSETQFLRQDARFIVRTADADGRIRDFEVTHTFGVSPLQQYLVEFPGGRLQALPFAWDSRSEPDGGQRWLHLYGDERIAPGDELHWTGRAQNWNSMCAECHATNLQQNYEAASDSFATSFSAMNVGCEACHGPASRHVAAARSGSVTGSKGLQVDLDDHGRATWRMNAATGIAERSEVALQQTRQPEACGRCHARRGNITSHYEFGKPLAETHRVALLEPALYFDDGQVRDEVYVYGSFLQSRMYRAGVTCSDCHDPHSLQLRAGPEPSDVCAQCHLPGVFASAEHHHHEPAAVACVDCHMPARVYMQVDARRDHGFRVPRPDLSLVSNAPNACANCHAERDAVWAAAAARRWWGENGPHFATAFAAARHGAANTQLLAVADDIDQSGIVRATALARLAAPLAELDAVAIGRGLADPDALLRMAALRAVRLLPADAQLRMAAPSLRDAVRGVRIEAALLLAAHSAYLPGDAGFARAADEYRAAQLASASWPEAHIALGDFEAAMNNRHQAVAHYSAALALDPGFAPARLHYADALRRFGDEPAAETLLREGIRLAPASAELHHSLGLLLIRTDRADDGLAELQAAADMAPDNARFAYVLGVALHSRGQSAAALQVLRPARQRFRQDFDIGWALATVLRDSGDLAAARAAAARLAEQWPDDRNVVALRASLRDP